MALRSFEAVVRLGTVEAAARELGLTPSALSHHLRAIRQTLGRPVLTRSGRTLVPTEDGRALAGALGPAYAAIDAALARFTGRRRGIVVTLQPSLAARWLIPRLPGLTASTDLDIVLSTTPRLVDLAREQIDCAIRLGPGA
ncbi:LysR family transcriptional regulator, partial [Stenotrophomonas sp. A3_2]|uniref:LysR family transcriptional regulator n=1 Tax=Stenotrophomonas sp. A3_2 TaxID=3119978 RepID=UPI002FC32CEC